MQHLLKRYALSICSATLILTGGCKLRNVVESTPKGTSSSKKALVLMYHDVLEIPDGASTDKLSSSDITSTALREQLDYLKSAGYKTISTQELFEAHEKKSDLPHKSVLLTFDDGYIGNYTYALPLLKNRELKASFFVHTNFVGVGPDDGTFISPEQDKAKKLRSCSDNRAATERDHMDWDHLREISADDRFEIYSHTHNHIRLTDRIKEDPDKQTITNDENYYVEMEMGCSRRLLEEKLGGDRPYFAYPFGAQNLKVVEAAQPFYKLAFVVNSPLKVHDAEMQIPRLDIGKNSLKLTVFKCRINAWMTNGNVASCS